MKESVPDLKEKLSAMLSYIEGNIINDKYCPDCGESTEANFGIISKQAVNLGSYIFTDTGKKYFIAIAYTIVDTSDLNNVGVTNIRLCDDTDRISVIICDCR